MFINIVFWLGSDRPTGLFRVHFTSFHTYASLLTFFCFFVLFLSCRLHAQVFGKTLVHKFLISYSLTE